MALVTVQRSPTPSTSSSPCVSEAGSGEDDRHSQPRSISENFLTVKGAALFLPRGNGSSPSSVPRITQRRNKHTGDLQQHLQTMFTLLRTEDTIRLAVRLESAYPQCTRYMVVVSTNGRQDTEESVVLGMDFTSSDRQCTVGLVLPLWSDTLIHLDGDGGFSVSTVNRVHVFKPVSVQAMWSALQSLHKACEVARCHNYYPGSLFLTWVSYYQSRIASEQHCINEWNAMQDVQSHRADSPVIFTDVPTERERTERLIKTRLREIMMQKDLENVTSKEIRTELEMQMVCNLREFKEFIDNEMIVILGQMDSPTEIFDHVYLGSEWNASNLEELQSSGVRYILNVTREIDNFFPGLFEYHNIRVYDEEATNLLEYWNDTYKFISKAKKAGAKCLVHCKMGVSRSASTVIAYAMKEYGWDLEHAFDHVKERRTVTKPNPSFMKQLEEYQGILLASKQRHNKLWRSHSDSDLSERQEPLRKSPHTVGRSDPHNYHLKAESPPSIQNILHTLAGPQPVTDETDSELSGRSSPVSNGLCKSEKESLGPGATCEDPLLPPMPRPRAATVVPEQNLVESCGVKVAVTVPIARPHPPPSVHVLLSSVAPSLHVIPSSLPPKQREKEQADTAVAEPPHSVPEPKTDSVELSPDKPDQNDNYQNFESSESRSLQLCLDTVSPNKETGLVLASPEASMSLNPTAVPPALEISSSSELDGCTSEEPSQGTTSAATYGSSQLSTDSIDFFSAREKFLGLSQDGQTRLISDAPGPRANHSRCPSMCQEEPSTEECYSHPESSSESVAPPTSEPHPNHQENATSVRHMVTELESVSQSGPSRSPQHHLPVQEEEKEEKEERPQLLASPSTPPSYDWPVGSVRRATEQLELRLRQEQESFPSRSPLPSPCTDTPPPECATVAPDPIRREDGRLADDDDSGIIQDPSSCAYQECSASAITVNPSLEPSSASSSLLWLEGVTEMESDADDPVRLLPLPHGRLARSSEDLQKIQETLRELQAFLYEAGGLAARGDPTAPSQLPRNERNPSEPEPEPRAESRTAAVWQRAMEIEARIRQAGLTPPSLMKRSASLAKLDQLELSMHDLNDWDFHPAIQDRESPSRSQNRTRTHSHCPDDVHKKQRVLPQSPSGPPSSQNSGHTSPSSPPPSDETGPASSPSSVSVCTRQLQQQLHSKQHQQHPVRRPRKAADKKKTVTVLYNTM